MPIGRMWRAIMITLKSNEQIDGIRTSCKLLAELRGEARINILYKGN